MFYSIPLERRTALNDLFFLLSLSMEMVCIILTLRQASLHFILNQRQNHNSVFRSQWWLVCILQFFITSSLFARFKHTLTVKRLATFPSPTRMSLTKPSMCGNNLIIPAYINTKIIQALFMQSLFYQDHKKCLHTTLN